MRLVAVATAALLVATAFAAGGAVAQDGGPPEPPHRVYGDVVDSDGNPVENLTVEIRHGGDAVVNGTTDGDGYYDVNVEGLEDGDELTITATGDDVTASDEETLTWSSANTDRVNLTVEIDTSGDDDSGGGGLPPIGGGDDDDDADGGDGTDGGDDTDGADGGDDTDGADGGDDTDGTDGGDDTDGADGGDDTDGADDGDDTDGDDGTGSADGGDSVPGFGPVVSLLALLSAAALATRHRT